MNERIRPVYKKKNDRRGKGNCRLDFSCADSKSIFRERGFPEATLLDKTDGKSRPPPPPISPQIKDGKVARFSFRAASSLIRWGDGGLLFHFILTN